MVLYTHNTSKKEIVTMIPSTKKTIRFNKDGKLRIVMFSDIQDTLDFNPNTLAGYKAIIEAEKPTSLSSAVTTATAES